MAASTAPPHKARFQDGGTNRTVSSDLKPSQESCGCHHSTPSQSPISSLTEMFGLRLSAPQKAHLQVRRNIRHVLGHMSQPHTPPPTHKGKAPKDRRTRHTYSRSVRPATDIAKEIDRKTDVTTTDPSDLPQGPISRWGHQPKSFVRPAATERSLRLPPQHPHPRPDFKLGPPAEEFRQT